MTVYNRSDGECGDWWCSECDTQVHDDIHGVDDFNYCPGCGEEIGDAPEEYKPLTGIEAILGRRLV